MVRRKFPGEIVVVIVEDDNGSESQNSVYFSLEAIHPLSVLSGGQRDGAGLLQVEVGAVGKTADDIQQIRQLVRRATLFDIGVYGHTRGKTCNAMTQCQHICKIPATYFCGDSQLIAVSTCACCKISVVFSKILMSAWP